MNASTVLFDDTVAGNIAYGADTADPARIELAARAAHAHDFICALAGGKAYDSPVGPEGSNLSGGQRQRLAIARVFYRDPDIVILDEATLSLDTEAEAKVQEALENLMSRRTVVVIAHRLSTVQHADNIVVLKDGRLAETGTHDELVARAGHERRALFS